MRTPRVRTGFCSSEIATLFCAVSLALQPLAAAPPEPPPAPPPPAAAVPSPAPVPATPTTPAPAATAAPAANVESPWGQTEDPDGDCKFFLQAASLKILVPGGAHSHDLSAELCSMNAPRVMREIEGDFRITVRVEESVDSKENSGPGGRNGFNGAGLLLMKDRRNYIRLERAVLHWNGGKPRPYINLESRVNGVNTRYGSTRDGVLQARGATTLRMERRGNRILSSISHNDGKNWIPMENVPLDPDWPRKVQVGVAAVSTSRNDFRPSFSALKIDQRKELDHPVARASRTRRD